MLELLAKIIIDTGLQAVGWGVMKGVSFGRYRGFQPEDVVLEATIGFITLSAVGYGVSQVVLDLVRRPLLSTPQNWRRAR